MKKQTIFALVACLATCFAFHSVDATAVGKDPTKTEISVASQTASMDEVILVRINDLVLFEQDEIMPLATNNDNSNYLSPAVSIGYADAAIPIRAQASYSESYSKRKPTLEITYNPLWDYNLNRYWC